MAAPIVSAAPEASSEIATCIGAGSVRTGISITGVVTAGGVSGTGSAGALTFSMFTGVSGSVGAADSVGTGISVIGGAGFVFRFPILEVSISYVLPLRVTVRFLLSFGSPERCLTSDTHD
jgi:hypothetical protein